MRQHAERFGVHARLASERCHRSFHFVFHALHHSVATPQARNGIEDVLRETFRAYRRETQRKVYEIITFAVLTCFINHSGVHADLAPVVVKLLCGVFVFAALPLLHKKKRFDFGHGFYRAQASSSKKGGQ